MIILEGWLFAKATIATNKQTSKQAKDRETSKASNEASTSNKDKDRSKVNTK